MKRQGSPLRILLVCNSEADGGAARSAWLLVRDFDRDRIDPVVVVHRESTLTARLAALGARYRVMPTLVETPTRPRVGHRRAGALLANLADLGRAAVTLRALGQAEGARLYYGQTTWSNVVCALAATRERPAIWHIRNDHSSLAMRLPMLGLARARRVQAIIAVSHAAAAPYRPLGRRVEVVPNGVDLAEMARARRGAPKGGAGPVRVGMAGRLVPHKGTSVFAAAARELARSAPEGLLRFVIIGGNAAHLRGDALGELARTMPPGTELTGYLPAPEHALAALDLLVVPSLYADPFPRVVIEALALGVPVVASRIGGIPEALTDGQEGFLVAPGDVPALADRILRLARDERLRARMGAAGLARVERCFSSTRVARQVERVIAGQGSGEVWVAGEGAHQI